MIWSPLLLLLSSQETLFLELCGRTREENHQGIARSKVAWCLQSPPTWEMWSLSRPLDYCHRATTRTGATKTGSTVHLPWALDSSTTCERTLCKNQDMLRNVPKCWAKTQSNCFKECFGRNIFETFLESFNKFGFSSVHLWGGGYSLLDFQQTMGAAWLGDQYKPPAIRSWSTYSITRETDSKLDYFISFQPDPRTNISYLHASLDLLLPMTTAINSVISSLKFSK